MLMAGFMCTLSLSFLPLDKEFKLGYRVPSMTSWSVSGQEQSAQEEAMWAHQSA